MTSFDHIALTRRRVFESLAGAIGIVAFATACSDSDGTTSDTDAGTGTGDTTGGATTPPTDANATTVPGETTDTTSPTTAAPAAPGLAKAKMALSTAISQLDPSLQQNASAFQTTVLTSGQLFRLSVEKEPQPELAESMELSDDGLTATVHLKSGLLYSDGTPVLASDAVFSLNRGRGGSGDNLLKLIDSAEAPDDVTVVFHLNTPYPELQLLFCLQYLVLHPQAVVESDSDYFLHPVSAGPYVVDQWVQGSPEMLLKANPNYVAGPASVAEIQLVAVPDLTSRILQLTTGAIDWAFDLPAQAKDSLPPEVALEAHQLGGMMHFTINSDKTGALADKAVRHAMSLAMDRDRISAEAFFGIAAPAQAYLYPGVVEFKPLLENGGKRDLDEAKRLIATTEFAGGFEFSLGTINRPGWVESCLIISENLAEIGITANVDPMEDAVMFTNAENGDFDVLFVGTVGTPSLLLKQVLSVDGFWAVRGRYDNPDVTKDIADAAVELDDAKRTDLMTDAQTRALDDMGQIPVVERAVLVGSRIEGDLITAVRRSDLLRVRNQPELA